MHKHLAIIKKKISKLKKLDPHYSIFGAEKHKYQSNPQLTEKNIEKFEKKFKVILPESYRIFLLEIGNGGVGPGYGVLPLDQAVTPSISSLAWMKLNFGKINKPFRVVNKTNYEGCLLISNGGEYLNSLFIVSGPKRDTICEDNLRESRKLVNTQLNFLEWYEKWLDESVQEIVQIEKKIIRAAKKINKEPQNPEFYRELAVEYLYEKGDKKKANENLDKALTLGYVDIFINCLDMCEQKFETQDYIKIIELTNNGIKCFASELKNKPEELVKLYDFRARAAACIVAPYCKEYILALHKFIFQLSRPESKRLYEERVQKYSEQIKK